MARSQKLSEKELVLLGLIAEAPAHAYALEEKIRQRRMTDWTEIGFSSIYRVLKSLEEKKLIHGRLEHQGQGATRRVFTLSAAGQKSLGAAVLERLDELKPFKNPFQVGLAYLTYASRTGVLEALEHRLSHLRAVGEDLAAVDAQFQRDIALAEKEATDPARRLAVERGKLRIALLLEHIHRHLGTERDFVASVASRIEQVDASIFMGDA